MGIESKIVDWFEDAKDYFEDDEIEYVHALLETIKYENKIRMWAFSALGFVVGAGVVGILSLVF